MDTRRVLPMLLLPPLGRSDARIMARRAWVGVLIAGLSAQAVLATSLTNMSIELPEPPKIDEASALARSTRVLDRNGELIAVLHGEEHRLIAALEDIPQHLRDAVIAVEDASFYEHNGIDVPAVARAFAANLAKGQVVQGGSTISQQYVRNVFDDIGREQTLGRKIEEARAALELEETLSKDEILERYLNTVYIGRGAYGVRAAAEVFFSRPLAELNLRQAALLAGVIHAPAAYRDPDALRVRRDHVLDRMAAEGMIPVHRAERAKRGSLGLRPSSPQRATRAPFFIEHVRRVLKAPEEVGGFGLTDADILAGGLTVHTTLDLRMQRAAERAVRAVLNRPDDPEAALVALSTDGEIRAMVGSRRTRNLARARGFNFATQRAPGGGRSSGSAFKTFTLATYLDQGRSPRKVYTAASRTPVSECGDGIEPWRPANYEGRGYGAMNVIEATEKSVNAVYAQMVAEVGPGRVVRMAERLGIESPLTPVCSITLGTDGVTPLEMARAYATFATRGRRPDVVAITRIETPDGKVIAEREPELRRALKRATADQVNTILQGVMTRGTGTPARISRPAAGKTGTTERRKDVWFAGYTPHPGLSAAVWMGYPPDHDGRVREMWTLHGRSVTGGGFAGDMWRRFMEAAMRDEPVRSFRDADLGGPVRSSTSSSVRQPSESGPRKEPKSDPSPGTGEEQGDGEPAPSPSPTAAPTGEPGTREDDDDD